MATGYADLLRARHAVRLLTGTLVGRLPNATAALAVVLFTRAHGGSYSLAGALSAVYGLGTAVGQPWLGRLVDRRGQPRVMLGGALVCAVATAAFALTGPRPLWLSCALMALAGLATPPLEGGLRALWPSVLGRDGEDAGTGAGGVGGAAAVEARLHAAYAMDAAAQEVMFAVGPLLVTLCIAATSTAAALLALSATGVAGTLVVVSAPPSRHWRAPQRAADWLGPLRSPGIAVLLGAFFFVGTALGSIAVAAVAYADRHGGGLVSSYLLSALGAGALVGGVTYGALHWAGTPERRLRALMAGLALAYLPLALVPGVPADDRTGRALRALPRAGAGLCLRGGRPARPGGHRDGGVLLDRHRLRCGRLRRDRAGRAGRAVRRRGGRIRGGGSRRGGRPAGPDGTAGASSPFQTSDSGRKLIETGRPNPVSAVTHQA